MSEGQAVLTTEQEELEKMYLADTLAILVDYDGFRTAEDLRGLIDEIQVRLRKLYRHEVTKADVF